MGLRERHGPERLELDAAEGGELVLLSLGLGQLHLHAGAPCPEPRRPTELRQVARRLVACRQRRGSIPARRYLRRTDAVRQHLALYDAGRAPESGAEAGEHGRLGSGNGDAVARQPGRAGLHVLHEEDLEPDSERRGLEGGGL